MSPELVSLLKTTAAFIELLGMSVLVSGFLFSVGRYVYHYRRLEGPDLNKEFKIGLGRAVVIGLEILVAATIVKTVTVTPTLASVGRLAGMIAIRTILSWTMVLEMDGHWPWQSKSRMRDT
ncbi:hypothetical protein D3OALGA1CA_365 [Olavius algarvensis associated proteobacterium Delta 3]|nr:hypothetical protein D3OALGA1CA_365 [Olavius algarvensis associated proteobacterium Delta 3]CAB5100925.1 hypothetical protein D3OALGB2SA_1831 [Olavius algarvensis associated proteobacterium Delta 3]